MEYWLEVRSRSKPIVKFCDSYAEAIEALDKLTAMGFTDLFIARCESE